MELNYTPGLTISEKAVSAFPLSIGTSLAFESVFSPLQTPYDPDRIIPDHIDSKQYQTCWVNVTTLFRNLVSAISKEAFLNSKFEELAATIEEEIGVIESLFQNEGQGICKPIFYYSTYEKLTRKKIPGLEFRLPHTEAQHFYQNQLLGTIKTMERHTDSIQVFHDSVMPVQHEKAFILTHQPYDLINFRKFSELLLLESNTGAIKPKSRWNSKYYPMSGESFVHLPFHRKILLIMGDKVLIRPMSLKIRKEILNVSRQYNWSPITTEEKIKLDLDLAVKDPYLAATIHAL